MTKILKKVQLSTEQSTPKSADPTKGTAENPYSQVEMATLQEEGTWNGGYVEGMGLVPLMKMFNSGGSNSGLDDSQRQELVRIAKQYIGKKEPDDNELILSWLKSVGVTIDDNTVDQNGNIVPFWCAAFVSAVYREAKINGANSALVSVWAKWGKEATQPQPGDVAIFTQGSHSGIVTEVGHSTIKVVYGNSSEQSVKEVSFQKYNLKSFRTI